MTRDEVIGSGPLRPRRQGFRVARLFSVGARVMTDHSAELEAALADAHLPSLAAATVHLTGDASFIEKANWPVYDFFGDSKLGGYGPETQAKLREAARKALEAHLGGAPLPPPPSEAVVRRMMDFVAGIDIP